MKYLLYYMRDEKICIFVNLRCLVWRIYLISIFRHDQYYLANLIYSLSLLGNSVNQIASCIK